MAHHDFRGRFLYACGHIAHYGHFLVDALLPFAPIYETLQTTFPTGTVHNMWLADESNQHMGTRFQSFFLQLFPQMRLHYCTPTEWRDKAHLDIQQVLGYKFGPYPVEALDSLRRAVDALLARERDPQRTAYPEVLLIERGFQPITLESQFAMNRFDTGCNRRYLRNHRELENVVATWCQSNAFSFENIVLENKSWVEQIMYFRNARLIIGQHGAGMCNVMFCDGSVHDAVHVMELTHWGLPTIKNLCIALGIDWKNAGDGHRPASITTILSLTTPGCGERAASPTPSS